MGDEVYKAYIDYMDNGLNYNPNKDNPKIGDTWVNYYTGDAYVYIGPDWEQYSGSIDNSPKSIAYIQNGKVSYRDIEKYGVDNIVFKDGDITSWDYVCGGGKYIINPTPLQLAKFKKENLDILK